MRAVLLDLNPLTRMRPRRVISDHDNLQAPSVLRDAERSVRNAARHFEVLAMIEAAGIVRRVLPDAGQIVVGLHEHYMQTGSAWLLAVHDHAGEPLWVLPHWAAHLRKHGGGADLPTAAPRALAEGKAEEDADEAWGELTNEVTTLVEQAAEFSVPESLGWIEVDPDERSDLKPFLIRLP